jgi:menaquinone-specific isochorismate synthase
MPVIPSAPELLSVRESLIALLSEHQRRVEQTGQARLLSLTLPVANLDPLSVLAAVASPSGHQSYAGKPCASKRFAGERSTGEYPIPVDSYFYLEKPTQAEALLAGPPLLQLQAEGSQRFSQTQEFVRHWQGQLFAIEQDKSLSSEQTLFGPRFCCSFTFFEHNPAGSPFAAATVFLPRWQVMCRGGQGAIVVNLLVETQTDLVALSQSLTLQVDWLSELARRASCCQFSAGSCSAAACGKARDPEADRRHAA